MTAHPIAARCDDPRFTDDYLDPEEQFAREHPDGLRPRDPAFADPPPWWLEPTAA